MSLTQITGRALAALAVTFLALALSTAAAAVPLFQHRATDLRAEVAAAKRDGKTLAVLFEMSDCQPCAALKQNVFPDPTARRGFGKDFRTVNVALDDTAPLPDPQGRAQTPAALAERYRIAGTPAILFLDDNGNLLYRYLGPLADGAALNLLGRFVREAHYESRPFADFQRAYSATTRHHDAASHGAAKSAGALHKPAGSADHDGPHHPPNGSHHS